MVPVNYLVAFWVKEEADDVPLSLLDLRPPSDDVRCDMAAEADFVPWSASLHLVLTYENVRL